VYEDQLYQKFVTLIQRHWFGMHTKTGLCLVLYGEEISDNVQPKRQHSSVLRQKKSSCRHPADKERLKNRSRIRCRLRRTEIVQHESGIAPVIILSVDKPELQHTNEQEAKRDIIKTKVALRAVAQEHSSYFYTPFKTPMTLNLKSCKDQDAPPVEWLSMFVGLQTLHFPLVEM
jgi:hypothetical protein